MDTRQIVMQKLLNEKLHELKLKNPSYSLRSFARKLKLDSGVLSGVLNGKRSVTRKFAVKVADQLALDPMERAELLRHFVKRTKSLPLDGLAAAVPSSGPASVAGPLMTAQLTADQFHLISTWYHYGILSLIETEGFRNDAEWIASRLGIRVMDARMALERLQRMGMLVKRHEGSLDRAQPGYRTTDEIRSISVRRAHAQNLELARESLERDDIDQRDFTWVTMPTNPAMLARAKERIRVCLDEIADILEEGPKTEVYQLCLQLIPLTRLRKKEDL